MLSRRHLQAAAAALVVLFAAVFTVPALSAPPAQTNLLQNPGFEAGTIAGWETWAVANSGGESGERCLNWVRPTFTVSTSSVNSGSYAAYYYTESASHNAGLLQTVSVTPGARLRFSIYARAVSADADYQNSDYTAVQIGIDPNGGRDASSASVVWSPVNYPMGGYSSFFVEATAASSQVTVFTRSQPNWCLAHNDVFFDDASLIATGTDTGATSQAGQTPVAGQTPGAPTDGEYQVATPDASGRVVHTVQEGDMLGTIASLYGVTVAEIVSLNNLASDDLIVLGQQLVVRSGSGGNTPQATTAPAGTATAGEADATAAPPSTQEPVGTASQEPVEVAEQPEAAATGSLCVLGFEDVNGNGAHDADEPNLAGITFVLNSDGQPLSRYTTDGISEPYCFADLLPGAYSITWQGDLFTPTTEQAWQVQLAGGDTLSHEFGAQPREAGEAGEVSQTGAGTPNWLTALLGSLGTMVALSAVGAVAYFAYIRPRML